MFVIQPFIQKPITKLINKIFGEPKAYLAKQKAASGETPEQQVQQPQVASSAPTARTNTNSTNLLEQWGASLPKTNTTISAVPIDQQNTVPSQTVSITNNVAPQQEIPALNIFKKKEERYIPSINVQYEENNKEIDAYVEQILKSTDSVMKEAKKLL